MTLKVRVGWQCWIRGWRWVTLYTEETVIPKRSPKPIATSRMLNSCLGFTVVQSDSGTESHHTQREWHLAWMKNNLLAVPSSYHNKSSFIYFPTAAARHISTFVSECLLPKIISEYLLPSTHLLPCLGRLPRTSADDNATLCPLTRLSSPFPQL